MLKLYKFNSFEDIFVINLRRGLYEVGGLDIYKGSGCYI